MSTAETRRGLPPEAFRFEVRLRVRFAETDAQRVVYNGTYFTYLEVGRVEYLRSLGFAISYKRPRLWDITVAEAFCRYHAPARFDEELAVRLRAGELKGSSFRFDYRIERREDRVLLTTAHTVQVFLDPASGRPMRIPDDVRAAIERFEGG